MSRFCTVSLLLGALSFFTLFSVSSAAGAAGSRASMPNRSAASDVRQLIGGARATGTAVRLHPPGLPRVKWPGPNQIALTFDDGPHKPTTERVVDIMAEHRIAGTFFVVGTGLSMWPEATQYAAGHGNSIQNHSWDHPHLRSLSDDRIRQELDSTSDAIEQIVGIRPTVFRPPYGSTDARVQRVAGDLGLTEAMWNAAPATMMASASSIIRAIVGSARANRARGTGVVALMHDGTGSRSQLLIALPIIIETLQSEGWEFVLLD